MAGPGLSVNAERYVLLVLMAIVVGATALVWRVLHIRHQAALSAFQEKEKITERLAEEHARRLAAERESRVLIQRLLNAQEDERSHLARELHDDVTQRLARLAIDASRLERGMAGFDNGNSYSMREELVRLSEDVHRLAYRLHPSILEELGLVEALQAECDRISSNASLPVAVTVRNVPRDISRQAALCVFRIAQESLRNVVRHAKARQVKLTLTGMNDGVQLSVQDDGVGFEQQQNGSRRHLGHGGMNERVTMLGGELDIESEPGHGTTVVAWVPVKESSIV